MSKPFWPLVVLLALTTPSAGCFFESPIDQTARIELDAAILGSWRCLAFDGGTEGAPGTFVVSADGRHRYKITFRQGDEEPEQFEAYASSVKNRPVLNIRVLTPRFPLKPWTFARYAFLRPNLVHVQLVNEDKLKEVAQSPASLRAALEKADGESDLYGDYCACVPTSKRE